MNFWEILAIGLLLAILTSGETFAEPEQALPDLSIEGILLPYISPIVYQIYPPPPPSLGLYYRIDATVTNQGTADAARFNVSFTVHFEGQMMPKLGANKTLVGLQQGAMATISFVFYPQDFGNYTLTITADSGNEVVELDETNNVKMTWVRCSIQGDLNGDGRVTSIDFAMIAGMYGRRYEFPPYPTADQNWDGYVGSADFNFLAGNYGKSI